MKMDEEHILFLKTNFKDIYELNHPNIIKYKNMYLDLKNKTSFLVMDYENHPSLLEYKDLSEDEIKLIAQQLLDTVAYIHSCNICHRDIKPDNVLYDRENKMIKLVDFGISKNVQNRGNKR
jgi:serine/threonine protein kinase